MKALKLSWLFVFAGLAVACSRDQAPESSGASRVQVAKGAPVLEMYVMSQCPYGVQVVDAIAPVADKLGPDLDLRIEYIGDVEGDRLTSMHGEPEVIGDIAQLCARELAPARYLELAVCQNKDPRTVATSWKECAAAAGIPVDKLQACVEGEQGKKLAKASFEAAAKRGATGSPTMFLNGAPYEGGRRSTDFLRAICGAYEGEGPKACSEIPPPVAVAGVFLSDKRCAECDITPLEPQLQSMLPGLSVRHLDYKSDEGHGLYTELRKHDPELRLPAILLDHGIDKDEAGKAELARYLRPVGDGYYSLALGASFDPTAEICDNGGVDDDGNGTADCKDKACVEAMTCRPDKPKHLALFVMSQCPYGAKAMIAAHEAAAAFGKDVTLDIHFIGEERGGELTSMHGQSEVDEDIREACAVKHYPREHKFLDYLACRSKDYRNPDWQACTGGNGIDAAVIQKCFDGEGKDLLRRDFALAKSLDIGASPTFLANNKHTFNAIDAEGIRANYCKHNPGLPGCDKTLSSETMGAPAEACGN